MELDTVEGKDVYGLCLDAYPVIDSHAHQYANKNASSDHQNPTYLKFDQQTDSQLYVATRIESMGLMLYGLQLGFSKKCFPYSSQNLDELIVRFNHDQFTMGLHPYNAHQFNGRNLDLDETMQFIDMQMTKVDDGKPRFIGYGEVSLHIDPKFSLKDRQLDIFKKFAQRAGIHKLPLVVHVFPSDVLQELAHVIKQYAGSEVNVQLHGAQRHPLDDLVKFGEPLKNVYYSFGLSNTNSKIQRQIFRDKIPYLPEDRLVIETDQPYSRRINKKAVGDDQDLAMVLYDLAKVKNWKLKQVARVTFENTLHLFPHMLLNFYDTS